MAVILSFVVALVSFFAFVSAQNYSYAPYPYPRNTSTRAVTWDRYSLSINGSRVFIFSGEFHYERLPVPELWLDVFQKFKANGLNTVSIPFFWSYHSPSRNVNDLKTGARDVQRLLDYAKQAGLYVIAKPGPYAGADTNGGGLPLWMSDGSAGYTRSPENDAYRHAYLPWIRAIGSVIAKNEIGKGGPVIMAEIENGMSGAQSETGASAARYVDSLKQSLRDAGVTVPLSSSERGGLTTALSAESEDVQNAVDIMGINSMPQQLSCAFPNMGFNVPRTYDASFNRTVSTQPRFLSEFETGTRSGWGAPTVYESCQLERSPEFPDVFYKNNIGQRVTLMNLYMGFGGTNWGHTAAPTVYTSYDYDALLSETRQITVKFRQTKLLAYFTRTVKELLKTDLVASGTIITDNADIFGYHLKNPDANTTFYVLQHASTPSRDATSYGMTLLTSNGNVTVNGTSLIGRQSKIVTVDLPLGQRDLLYSTADILTYGYLDDIILILYSKIGQTNEFAWNSRYGSRTIEILGAKGGVQTGLRHADDGSGPLFPTYRWTQTAGKTVIRYPAPIEVWLIDEDTARTMYAPSLTASPDVGPKDHIFVFGVELVRNAVINGTKVFVTGDNFNDTTIEVYIGKRGVKVINWNGRDLPSSFSEYGSLKAPLPGVMSRSVETPVLNDWKVADSLPEIAVDYDDSKWTVCNKNSSSSPVKPLSLPVLFSSDYGYFAGTKVYRGYFDGKMASSVNLTASGGLATGWTAWLNGELLGGHGANVSSSVTSAVRPFENIPLNDSKNVITVVTSYTGHDQADVDFGIANPRGLLGAFLTASNGSSVAFTQWKIAGNAGGDSNIDPVRGPMNEGGLYGERLGWHLPGFDTAAWSSFAPTVGLSKAGVNFYVTNFTLNIDEDLDFPMGFEFAAPENTIARLQLFVNGYQFGNYVPHVGPQTRFPVPPGILNTRGSNTLALSFWAMTAEGASLHDVKLVAYNLVESSFDFGFNTSSLQPGWTESRLSYS